METTTTLKDIKQILKDLIKKNNPNDKELIIYYTKSIVKETGKAFQKLIK